MDTLQSMKIFVRVAQRSGFAAAARELRMSPAAVTKHVAFLESRLGARLFDRTTRRVGLTEAGRVYVERCLECLHAAEDADASIGELAKKPSGILRVSAPVDLQMHLPALISRFMNNYPDITVDLRLTNRPVDLVEEGVDVALRAAPALDGQFIARQLATVRIGVFATPDYLRRHGRPKRPEDLSAHRSLVFVEPRPRDEWSFTRDGVGVRVKLHAVLLCNNGETIRAALVAGVGLTLLPSFLVHADLAAGRVEPLLLDWSVEPQFRLYAVYPHRRFVSPKVRAFIDALRSAYGDGTSDPWWPAAFDRPAPPSGRERKTRAGRGVSRRRTAARPG